MRAWQHMALRDRSFAASMTQDLGSTSFCAMSLVASHPQMVQCNSNPSPCLINSDNFLSPCHGVVPWGRAMGLCHGVVPWGRAKLYNTFLALALYPLTPCLTPNPAQLEALAQVAVLKSPVIFSSALLSTVHECITALWPLHFSIPVPAHATPSP